MKRMPTDPQDSSSRAERLRREGRADFRSAGHAENLQAETLREFRYQARSATLLFAIVAGFLVSHFSQLSAANAQDDPTQLQPSLRFELRNQQTVRTGGPIPVTFDLVWDGAGVTLLEGQLRLLLTDGIETYGHYVSSDLAINPGTTTYRILLPSIEGRAAFQTVDLLASFVTPDGDTFDLESRPLRIAPDVSRFFRVVYCDPVSSTDDRRVAAFLNTLKFEQFWQAPGRNQPPSPDNVAITYFDSLRPADLPADPHWFCTTSIIVLSRNAFSELRPRQLDALLQWVKAGGSLCVEPLGGLDDAHLEFLNKLAIETPEAELVIDDRGQLIIPADRSFRTLSCGLGKAVVLYAALLDDFDTTAAGWQSAVAGLWHFRADQQQAIATRGRFQWLAGSELYPDNLGQPYRNNRYRYYGNMYQQNQFQNQQSHLGVRPVQSVQGLLERLMPQDVEVVPLPYIGAILVFYLLTIGPVDYFVLGMFKARRFTWITFPLATIGFTLFTVWLSNTYLSSSAERTFVQILDMTSQGEVARSNRLELLFTMSSNEVTTDVKSGIFTALDHSRFGGTVHDQYQRPVHRRTVPAPIIAGRPPGVFAAVQAVPKWTPQINRVFQIAPDAEQLPTELPEFDWQSPRDLSDVDEREQLRDSVVTAFGGEATAVLFNSRKAIDLVGSRTAVFQESMLQQIPNNATRNREEQWTYTDFLWDSSVRLQGPGLFGAVCRVSPHGGANFEDLTLLDPSDATQWLLVIAVPHDENMTIYRRLYQSPGRPVAQQESRSEIQPDDDAEARAGAGETLIRGQQ